MQKDLHWCATNALAQKAGIKEAELIAWSDCFTDKLRETRLHGIRTQASALSNWADKQIQRTVLVPFHFIPGNSLETPHMVTANSRLANIIVEDANSPIELGIALHSLQDTYSHQGFTGWQEKFNRCYSWVDPRSLPPAIGHAEMIKVPDIISQVWTDPRTGQTIDNKSRAFACLKKTYEVLCNYAEKECNWDDIAIQFKAWVAIRDYDERKKTFNVRRFSEVNNEYDTYVADFERAAAKQLSLVL